MKRLVAVLLALALLAFSSAALAHHETWVPSCAWVHPEAGRVYWETRELIGQGRSDPEALEQAAAQITRFFEQVIPRQEVFVDDTSPLGPITHRVPPVPCGW